MDDEQIAQTFVRQVKTLCNAGMAIRVLTAIIGEARSTERARCAAIAERVARDDMEPGIVSGTASAILAEILRG